MQERRTLRLRLNARGRGTIAIDGYDISDSVSAVKLEADVAGVNRATITFLAVNLDVDAEVGEVERNVAP